MDQSPSPSENISDDLSVSAKQAEALGPDLKPLIAANSRCRFSFSGQCRRFREWRRRDDPLDHPRTKPGYVSGHPKVASEFVGGRCRRVARFFSAFTTLNELNETLGNEGNRGRNSKNRVEQAWTPSVHPQGTDASRDEPEPVNKNETPFA
jgi:hypothetical protein